MFVAIKIKKILLYFGKKKTNKQSTLYEIIHGKYMVFMHE